MENFIVSARKYRPVTFNTVVGQMSITTTLKNAIRNNQLAQAFLFCGPRGVGKTTCARILAKTINCDNPTSDIEACNVCPSCISFNESSSFNIHELDAASNNSVDGIRGLIDQVRIPPQSGRYKVYIIDEVHMLSNAAFNAFLKTLEEPPAYAKFILATTDKHKIIPTILSRCQIFDFKRIGIDDIAKHLAFVARSENVNAEETALHTIAQKADGALRDALSIFDQIVSFGGTDLTYEKVIENLNVLDYDYYFKVTQYLLSGDLSNTLITINEIIENGFDGQNFLLGLGEHLRNLLMCKDASTVKLIETSDAIRQRYIKSANECSIPFLLHALDLSNKCDLSYKISNNKRLHVELALMQMCELHHKPVESDKKKLPPTDPAPAPALPNKIPVPDQTAEKQQSSLPIKEPISVKQPTPGPEPPKAREQPQPQPNVDQVKTDQAKPVTQIPPIQTLPASMPPGNFSIKGIGHYAEAPDAEESENISIASEPLSTPFTAHELTQAWLAYANQFITTSPNYYSTLTKRLPELNPDFSISLKVDNKFQEEELLSKRHDLLSFLSNKLQNNNIMLEITVTLIEDARRPYTDQDKFAALAAKNPALMHLRKELDLELDL
ncbi:MAG TPA: DNA polymerase III subunit gamma/tau [Bacteroidales bacterium]